MRMFTRSFLFVFLALFILSCPVPVLADGYENLAFTCVSGDCRDGMGVAQWPDGARYEGEFAAGQRHGQGTMAWPGGDRYSGEWDTGVQHGHGTMAWATGARYIGQWAEGERTGAGSLIYASGKRIDGYFENGRLKEAVRITDPLAVKPKPKPKPKTDTTSASSAPATPPATTTTPAPSSGTTSPPPATTTPTPVKTTQNAPAPAAGDVAAILVEVSAQGVVRFVNLYTGPSLAAVRQTAAKQSLPQGYTGREVQNYQGSAHWVAQYGTYDDVGSSGFCYAVALDCSNREECEARVRQEWAQAGCKARETTEGFSAYNDGAYHGLLPTGFPQVHAFY